MKRLMVLVLLAMFSINSVSACTTMIVGKGATVDGSIIVAHSDDDELMDQRIVYVPAMDHAPGSKRPVYYDPDAFGGKNVRYVGSSRGPGYVDPSRPASKPLGYIPQISHTYAYFDGNYGIINEHQLAFGECTNGAKFQPKQEPGKRIFYSAELSRVALERCATARQAIKLMGQLMEDYGYYGTGETLLVGDTMEAWVLEMCAVPNRKAGLWVAKRVPDDQVFAAANEFRIREIDPNDPNLMYTKDLFKVCEGLGWWRPAEGKLDWLKTVSLGEYNHPYYSLRRVWRIFSRIKPSANFSPWVENGLTNAYPFSIKPDKKLSARDVMDLYRDHYEGTEFDMTKGMAAGPFGSPERYFGPYDGKSPDVASPGRKMEGAWERPISVHYAGYTFVNQARGWLPDPIGGICWFAPDKAATSCFVPFYAGATDLPSVYQTGDTDKFDRQTAWWAFNFVSNWANLKYSYMIKDIVAKQQQLEAVEFTNLPKVDQQALALYKNDPKAAKQYLTKYLTDNANKVVKEWWALGDYLIAKYDDGYVNKPKMAEDVGYPNWWLDQVGYADGPTTYKETKNDN
ncbi:MAG: C69 family dipeptidase [Candidatus Margulisbacteria bacterium]|nr:C69 family dipeptidase [Candidatus Margulisiibacteriota bacterium]